MGFDWFAGASPILLGTLGSLIAGLGSGVGALPVYAMRRISVR